MTDTDVMQETADARVLNDTATVQGERGSLFLLDKSEHFVLFFSLCYFGFHFITGTKQLKKSGETYTVLQDPKNKHKLKRVLKDKSG